MKKSLNDFIEQAAKSVDKKEQRPKCPEGQYYDPIRQKCVIMPAKYGGRFWGGTFHKPTNGNGNGNGNGSHNGNGGGNGNGGSGHSSGGNGNGGNGGGSTGNGG